MFSLFSAPPTDTDKKTKKPPPPAPNDDPFAQLQRALQEFSEPVVYFTAGSLVTLSTTFLYRRYGRRIRNASWVTPNILQRWIKGVVVSVPDGDNIRLYHTPGFGWRWPLKFRSVPNFESKIPSGETIHIRLAGIDAPEDAHFGRPAQKYAKHSRAWLEKKLLGKKVWCLPIFRDQYSRIVASVVLPSKILPGRGQDISLEMLRAGWAIVYEQANATYGVGNKEEYCRVEKQAAAAKRGIWKYPELLETPTEYKRRFSNITAPSQLVEISGEPKKKTTKETR